MANLTTVAAPYCAGPPRVTCRFWCIVDPRTGKVLWGCQENKKREIASLTKMMTALVISRIAERDPSVLDELVLVSERAAGMNGTSATLRAYERATVRDLLFGLMLPSGNDAAVALAEHFGALLLAQRAGLQRRPARAAPQPAPAPPPAPASEDGDRYEDDEDEDDEEEEQDEVEEADEGAEGRSVRGGGACEEEPGASGAGAGEGRGEERGAGDALEVFVEEMNRVAGELGMAHTRYGNPHGLSRPARYNTTSTCADQARLSCALLRVPLLAHVVRQKQHTGRLLSGRGDEAREVVWQNTNPLLGKGGFHGTKTGITPVAGPCLASSARRRGVQLVIVSLASSSVEARTRDHRLLLKWAAANCAANPLPGAPERRRSIASVPSSERGSRRPSRSEARSPAPPPAPARPPQSGRPASGPLAFPRPRPPAQPPESAAPSSPHAHAHGLVRSSSVRARPPPRPPSPSLARPRALGGPGGPGASRPPVSAGALPSATSSASSSASSTPNFSRAAPPPPRIPGPGSGAEGASRTPPLPPLQAAAPQPGVQLPQAGSMTAEALRAARAARREENHKALIARLSAELDELTARYDRFRCTWRRADEPSAVPRLPGALGPPFLSRAPAPAYPRLQTGMVVA
eukprot:tig00020537_g10286.t1